MAIAHIVKAIKPSMICQALFLDNRGASRITLEFMSNLTTY